MCNKFNDYKGYEQTIEMDEETIDAEIGNSKQIQAVINTRLTQLQTAKDKTAKPWNQGISCTIHADLRKAHVAKSSLDSLVCIACKECAFCVPKYGDCWPSGGGKFNNYRRHPHKKMDSRTGYPAEGPSRDAAASVYRLDG